MRLAAAVCAALLCSAVAAPAGAAPVRTLPTVLQDDARFLHGTDEEVAAAMRRASSLGIDRVRLTASWGTLTRDPEASTPPAHFDASDPAAYDQGRWAELDRAVRLAAGRGIGVMIDVGFWAPVWATAGSPDDGVRPRTGIVPRHFARFSTAVARRYSGTFTPKGDDGPLPRAAWLVLWNEPNHPAFMLPQYERTAKGHEPVSPHAYRAMVRAAYPAVKAASPGVSVLIGNTSAIGGDGGRSPVAPLRFIRAMACVDERLRPVRTGRCSRFGGAIPGDGWAHHPYALGSAPHAGSRRSRSDDARIGDLPRMAALLRRLSDAGHVAPGLRAIHLTEFGYETRDLPGRPGLPEVVHARYLTWSEYLATRVPAVKSFAQFLLHDVPPAPLRQSDSPRRPYGEFSSGLWGADGEPKLAARTFRAGLFAGRTATGLRLWGRLRLGPSLRSVRIERSLDGGRTWTRLRELRVPGDRAFVVPVPSFPRAQHRLAYRAADGAWVAGLPVGVRSTRVVRAAR